MPYKYKGDAQHYAVKISEAEVAVYNLLRDNGEMGIRDIRDALKCYSKYDIKQAINHLTYTTLIYEHGYGRKRMFGLLAHGFIQEETNA